MVLRTSGVRVVVAGHLWLPRAPWVRPGSAPGPPGLAALVPQRPHNNIGPSSGVKFGQGEGVVKVRWYDRWDGRDHVFDLRRELGGFYVSTTMLRAGLRAMPIELRREEARSTRQTTTYRYEISQKSDKHILDMIENVFRDRSHE